MVIPDGRSNPLMKVAVNYLVSILNIEKARFQLFFHWMLGACVLLVLISIFQDYYQAIRNGSSFYLSESLLFDSFWIFFIFGFFILIKAISELRAKPVLGFTLGISCAVFIHWSLYAISVFCISFLFFKHTYTIFHTVKYSISTLTLSSLLVYGMGYIIIERKLSNKTWSSSLRVKVGSKFKLIEVDDIVSVQSEAPYLAIHTLQGRFLYNGTLKELEKKLDPHLFVRIHKSCIINVSKVLSYSSRKNGDYDVMMKNETSVRLSRNFASRFKQQLNHRSTM